MVAPVKHAGGMREDPRKRHMKANFAQKERAYKEMGRPRGGLGGPKRRGNKWDALKVLGGTLMDLDGTMGYGHRDAAMQGIQGRRAQEDQQRREAERQAQMAKFAEGLTPEQQALFQIAPNAVIGGKAEQMFAQPQGLSPSDQLAREKFEYEKRSDKEARANPESDLPTGMRISAETGQPEWIPGYLEGQERLRTAGKPSTSVTVESGLDPSAVPSGWEGYVQDGKYMLRPTPGGPADIETKAGEGAKGTMDAVITTFASEYQKLNEAGAVRNSEKGPLANFQAYMQTSPMGREFGKMTGSPAEAARETIEALQPNIVQAIMSQPGISARAFDSDKELEFFLRSITAPRADYMANMSALYILDKKFGTGTAIEKILTPDEIAAVQQMSAADPLNFQLDQVLDAQAPEGGSGEVFDESLLEFMDPEDRALFSGGMQ